MELIYKANTASQQDIYNHFVACDQYFIPVLSGRVDLKEYSGKIAMNAKTFEAWNHNELAGLVAMYPGENGKTAFITNVSVLKKYGGKKVSGLLMTAAIDYCRESKLHEILLEVHEDNLPALNLYKKYNFVTYGKRKDVLLMKLEI